MLPGFGKVLILIGLILVVIGVLFVIAGRFPSLHIGRLPGDIVYRRGNFTFYFPLATCILISLLLMLIFWVFGRR